MRITDFSCAVLFFSSFVHVHADEENAADFRSIDIQPKANFSIATKNQLKVLAEQTHTWSGVPFTFGSKGVRLGGKGYRNELALVENIRVDHSFSRLHIIHAAKHGGTADSFDLDGTLIGQYQIRYEDGLIEVIPIVYGEDVRDWWNWDKSTPVKRGKEILRGETPDSKLRDIGVRLYLSTWQNPRPRIRVESITFVSVFDAVASPFCVAMTTQQSMEPSPEDGSYASKPGRRKTNWSNRESVGQ